MKYRWVEITFYSFHFTQKDIAAARQGNIEPMEKMAGPSLDYSPRL